MPKSALYLAAYDVTSQKERSQVATVLEGFGMRVQKSVFECRLSRSGRERLLRRLQALPLKTGFVSLYRLDGRARQHHIGDVPADQPQEATFAFILTDASPG